MFLLCLWRGEYQLSHMFMSYYLASPIIPGKVPDFHSWKLFCRRDFNEVKMKGRLSPEL